MTLSLHPSRRRFIQSMSAAMAGSLVGCASNNFVSEFNQPPALDQFISGLPKAELHVHLEGTVEPATAIRIANRNGTHPPYPSVEAYEAALNFTSLESFLDAFHKTIAVLEKEEDFYEITYTYLEKSHNQTVRHVDIKFDPQAHQRRGIKFATFFDGIRQAQIDATKKFGISSQLIMCLQRDASLESAEAAYTQALKHQEHIAAIGLDNTETLNFPAKFSTLFSRAKRDGFKLTSHCDLGQPNSTEHIRACIEDLQVDRLDHGYNIIEDKDLAQLAADKGICFTACPTSAFNTPEPSTRFYFSEVCRSIAQMLDLGLRVTLNTDDPGVMGARYLNETMADAARFLELNQTQVTELAANSFRALWIPADQKRQYLDELASYRASVS